MTTRAEIDSFLAEHRIAFVGLSRNRRDFSRTLFKEFRCRGYDAIPVNPNATEIEGLPSYPSLAKIPGGVSAAILLMPPAAADAILADSLAAGVRHLWLYGATQSRKFSPSAQAFCRERGISAIEGECPFMFLPQAGLPHRVHGFCRKLFSAYPA